MKNNLYRTITEIRKPDRKFITNVGAQFKKLNEIVTPQKEDESDTGVKMIGQGQELYKKHVDALTDSLTGVSVTFDPLVYDKNAGQVSWSGTVERDFKWRFIYNSTPTEGYFGDCSNLKLEKTLIEAMYKLANYYQNWFEEMKKLVMNKQI